ncbi:capsular biosynthesis protein [Mangrovimicrobium sediminis]|uniref:protein-tyrosine-phosphatase n=1 Tax=Mangrovimicrobium sediminis TaxID=2562682 RepID=A0A4Z0M0S0_9GAMM|nr:CpsB/CapC family capsule biosynthesis tyrosine phosphatase [Haliea sp. SAOS-164]TGD73119.1 capsular biosynthesis protein [Haliea sp. SAOS-164]
MIDLHCHILPGIDDGAPDTETALSMARLAAADGIRLLACTPHIHPGRFDNDAAGIASACADFRERLREADIALELTTGADAHITPELLPGLRAGRIPTLHGSRYFLCEPSHQVPLPGLPALVRHLLGAGYVPVITHPERLRYIDSHYELILESARLGAWVQLTAGSLTGRFGEGPQAAARRLLEDGVVHLLATDAHNTGRRAPLLTEGREAAAQLVGEEEASRLVLERPQAVIDDLPPEQVAAAPAFAR